MRFFAVALFLTSCLLTLLFVPVTARAQANAWVGTYTSSTSGGTTTCQATGTGNSLTYACKFFNPPSQSDEHTQHCTISGNTGNCTYTDGHYHDLDKDQYYTGTGTVTLSGNQITERITVQTEQWVGNNAKTEYPSAHAKGSVLTGTETRSGPAPTPTPTRPPTPPMPPTTTPMTTLRASYDCQTSPFEIRISELPSRICTVWISNWIHNTSSPVTLVDLTAADAIGNHFNGIQIFAGFQPGEPVTGVDPANMGGFEGPDGSYGNFYPWTILVFACPAQPGTGANCDQKVTTPGRFIIPLEVQQAGANPARFNLAGTALGAAPLTLGAPPANGGSLIPPSVPIGAGKTGVFKGVVRAGPPSSASLRDTTLTVQGKTYQVGKAAACIPGDPSAFLMDAGAHFNYAAGNAPATFENNLLTKIRAMYACKYMSQDQATSLYARISVLIAEVEPNAQCFGGDTGAVNTNFNVQKAAWAGNNAGRINNLLWKVEQVFRCVTIRNNLNTFYSAASLAIATSLE